MEHEMILMDADFRTVCVRLTARRKRNAGVAQVVEQPGSKYASLVQQAEHGFRTPDTGVQVVNGAPIRVRIL